MEQTDEHVKAQPVDGSWVIQTKDTSLDIIICFLALLGLLLPGLILLW